MFRRGKLTRFRIQSGCVTRKNLPIDGIFEIMIDESDLVEMMEKASKSKGKTSVCGPVVVNYQKATREQADLILVERT